MKTPEQLKKEIDELREKLKPLEVEYYNRTNKVLMTARISYLRKIYKKSINGSFVKNE